MVRTNKAYAGIDVSAVHLDMAVLPSGEERRFSNDPEGIKTLTDRLAGMGSVLVVLEATGGLEVPVVGELALPGRPSSPGS